jgi:hypothetical protein
VYATNALCNRVLHALNVVLEWKEISIGAVWCGVRCHVMRGGVCGVCVRPAV